VIDFTPSDEQALIIETVHQFAEKEIRELARTCDEDAAIPAALLDSAHELGLVANGLPEALGGGGERSALTGCLIAEELAWGDLAIALSILSPSTAGKDREIKMPLYAHYGVRYAWLIDPRERTLEAHALLEGAWTEIGRFAAGDRVAVQPFEAITIDLADLWA